MDSYDEIVAHAIEHAAEIGLPAEFIKALESEDDWSFVIKGHAFLEAILTNTLSVKSGTSETKQPFAELEMSNGRYGKVAFGKAFGVLVPEDRRFLRSLSELRNELVHDIANVSFDVETHFGSLNRDNKRNFLKGLCYADATGLTDADLDHAAGQWKGTIKHYIWRSIVLLAAVLVFVVKTERLNRDEQRFKDELLERIRSNNDGQPPPSPFGLRRN